MKEYRFYFKEPDMYNHLKGNYKLYGLTNNKKLANQFLEFRNKKLCKFVKENVDEDEWHDHCRNNRLKVLKLANLSTFKIKDGCGTIRSAKFHDVPIVITDYEESVLSEITDDYMNTMNDYCTNEKFMVPPPYIFKSKIQKSLEALYYDKLYASTIQALPSSVICQETKSYIAMSEGYDMPDIFIDELGLFIRYFWFTFDSKPFDDME